MTEPLTERQEKILAFIKKSIQDQGYPPTIREIGEHFGIRSTNGANDHLKPLERKGPAPRVIDGGRSGTAPRFARLSRRPLASLPEGDVVDIPVVGKVAAG